MNDDRSLSVSSVSVPRANSKGQLAARESALEVTTERSQAGGNNWTPAIDARMARLEGPVRELIGSVPDPFADAAEITLLPDVHYPFHPSTGMVTDPAVVGAVAGYLGNETSADLVVAGSSTESMDLDRTTDYLGYPALEERFDCRLRDLSSDRDSRVTVSLSDSEAPVELSIPDLLLENPVVVVPTLRPTEAGPIAGAMRTLGRHVEPGVEGRGLSDDRRARAATNAVEPELSILDATTVFAGEAFAAETLFAGDPLGVDTAGTTLLGRDVNDDAVLSTELGPGQTSIQVSGCDFDALRDRVPSGDLPPRTTTHPAVSIAYGLYAKVSGDAVPPQLEVDR
ncbi:DUF362 domain-containing protein [Halostagnicola sp. A-GB9-2]|uniref:DUF362 domain-containing protein n=1 Tax=Halostagnicola sp. A-GB9-2 TaxID=3048066 RepID=UPI0024BFCB2A|nr:DUF362 domain-containing protein [Halostagnicola sp. A-GB9-2]MDJ1434516.1 DUF362 domain-containing protein [Halostagnicola sp. A-GB9-2]